MVCVTVCGPCTGVSSTFLVWSHSRLAGQSHWRKAQDLPQIPWHQWAPISLVYCCTSHSGEPKLSKLLVRFTRGISEGQEGREWVWSCEVRSFPFRMGPHDDVHSQSGVGPVQHWLIALLLTFLMRWLETHRRGMLFNLVWHRVSALYYNSLFPTPARIYRKWFF